MTDNRNKESWRAILLIATVAALLNFIVMGSGAMAAPAAQQVVLAPQPNVSCGSLTPGANDTWTYTCTLTGLVAAPTTSPTPTATSTPTPTLTPTSSPSTTSQPPTSTPAPTTTTPRPTSSQNGCISNPGACGFPDAASTGPTSPPLVILNGNQSFSTPGQTIANTRINGCVEVHAANITFRNVFFNGNNCFYALRNFSTGLQVFDSEATCGGANGTAFVESNISLTRVDIHGCENGLSISGSVLVQDSWIHNMVTANGAHTDGAQFNQGATDITFRHNTINVGPGNGATSAIIMWDEGGSQNKRVSIDNNLMAWGTYTVYCGREGVIDNIRVTNNRFGPFEFGYANSCNSGETWFGNINDANGAVLVAT